MRDNSILCAKNHIFYCFYSDTATIKIIFWTMSMLKSLNIHVLIYKSKDPSKKLFLELKGFLD